MSIAITPLYRPEIEYPDRDGQPLPDNTLRCEWIVTIKAGLEALFRDDPLVFVAGDHVWCPESDKPYIGTAPDIMVVFGRPKGYGGYYKQWTEDGIAPQVVFDVVSPANTPEEMIDKFEFYQRHGVEEYYLYDPPHRELVGWLRGASGLEEIEDLNGFTSPRLTIRFEVGEGPNYLKIFGPNGERFLTYVELSEDRALQRERAETERKRAETERERADRLAAQLRQMGIEPAAVFLDE